MGEQILYPSAARTATPAAVDIDLIAAKGLVIVVDVTAIVTAPSVVVTIDGVDVATGKTWNILTSAAITAVTGATPKVFKIGQGITVAANVAVSDLLPEKVRVTFTHANGNSITYQATAHLL